jgi:hypothetical protein
MLRVNVASNGQPYCAAAVSLAFDTHIAGTTPFGPFDSTPDMMSWHNILSGNRAAMPKRVTDEIESMTKEFVVQWRKDNP